LLIDDANRIDGLAHILEYCTKEGYEIKIIATVRDYAKYEVQNVFAKYVDFLPINLSIMTDENIDKLLNNLGIKNPQYLEIIRKISENNPRIAYMAGKTVIDKKLNLKDAHNAEPVYKSYYSEVISDIKENFVDYKDIQIFGVLGILSYYNTMNLVDNKEILDQLLISIEISKTELKDIVSKLNDLEIIDSVEGVTAKITDQCLKNYLLYYVFYEKKYLELNPFLTLLYKNKALTIDAVGTLANVFHSDDMFDYLTKEINIIWNELKGKSGNGKEDFDNYVMFVELFYPFNETDTLLLLKEEIDILPDSNMIVTKEEFYNKSHNFNEDRIIKILGGFSRSEAYGSAIDLLIQYYLKCPNLFHKVSDCLQSNYGIKIHDYSYYLVNIIVDKLTSYDCADPKNENIVLLAIKVFEHYIKTSFDITEPANKGMAFRMYQGIPVILNDGSKKYREKTFEYFGNLIDTKFNDYIYQTLFSYHPHSIRDSEETDKLLVFDVDKMSKNIFSKLNNKLTFENYLIYSIIKEYNREKKYIEPDDYINKTSLVNTVIECYDIHSEIKGFEKQDENLSKLVAKIVVNYTAKEFEELLKFVSKLNTYSNGDDWKFTKLITEIFKQCEGNEFYFDLIDKYFNYADSLRISPYNIVPYVYKTKGFLETEKILLKYKKMDHFDYWYYELFRSMTDEDIKDDNIEKFYIFLDKKLNLNRWYLGAEFLEKVYTIKQDVYVKTWNILMNKEDDAFNAFTESLFNCTKITGKQIYKLFQEDIPLLKRVLGRFIPKEKYGLNVFIKDFLNVDISFVEVLVDGLLEAKKFFFLNKEDLQLSIIWQTDSPEKIVDLIMNNYILSDKLNRFEKEFIIKSLLLVDNDLPDTFIISFIEKYLSNEEMISLLFEAISDMHEDKRLKYVEVLLNKNVSFAMFENVSIYPSSQSWSGSEVPIIEKRIQYYEKIKNMCNKTELLQHKNHIDKRLIQMNEYKKNIRIREFCERYY